MESLKLTLKSYGKLTAGNDHYMLLAPRPIPSDPTLDLFPGTKFYAAFLDPLDGEIFNPHYVSVGDGFHIDIVPIGRDVQVTIYDQGGTTQEESIEIPDVIFIDQ